MTNPMNGITSGGNIFKAGQQGVTLGNVGVGDSIQVGPFSAAWLHGGTPSLSFVTVRMRLSVAAETGIVCQCM